MSFLSDLFGSSKKNIPSIPVLPADIYATAAMELQDVIAPSAVEIESSTIKLGDKIAKTYFAMSYPRILSAGWLAPIVNLDKVFDISIPGCANFIGNGILTHNCGQIEQDADIVAFIHREELHDKETDKKGIAELHIAKHRNGALGVIPMRFDGITTKFDNLQQYRGMDGY
jgi:replicative DNA helicase